MRWLIAAALMLFPVLAQADVVFEKETSTLTISGPTTDKQVIKASNILREEDVKYIFMWGPGGLFEAGLHLGKRIKKEEGVTVIIPENKECISACAMIALAADRVIIDGNLMLHRPYVPAIPVVLNLEDAMGYMGKGYIMMAFYFEDIGYPRSMAMNIMEYTNPCRFLTYSERVVVKQKGIGAFEVDDRCDIFRAFRR